VARTSGLKPSCLQHVLSVLGGADSQILARARVDTAEMTGRGIAALIPAVFGGLAALISFRYAYELSGICPSSAVSALAEASPGETAVAYRKLG
jgi:hypothetical protein